MKKFLIPILCATFSLFIWNAISWMVLPFHGKMLNTLPTAAFQTLDKESITLTSGIYHYPGLDDPEMESKAKEGPRIPFMVFVAEGSEAFNPINFLKSFLFNLISATLLLLLLLQLKGQSLKHLLKVGLIVALMIGFMSDLPQTSWYLFPTPYALINMLDHLVGFFLATLVLGKMAFK